MIISFVAHIYRTGIWAKQAASPPISLYMLRIQQQKTSAQFIILSYSSYAMLTHTRACLAWFVVRHLHQTQFLPHDEKLARSAERRKQKQICGTNSMNPQQLLRCIAYSSMDTYTKIFSIYRRLTTRIALVSNNYRKDKQHSVGFKVHRLWNNKTNKEQQKFGWCTICFKLRQKIQTTLSNRNYVSLFCVRTKQLFVGGMPPAFVPIILCFRPAICWNLLNIYFRSITCTHFLFCSLMSVPNVARYAQPHASDTLPAEWFEEKMKVVGQQFCIP